MGIGNRDPNDVWIHVSQEELNRRNRTNQPVAARDHFHRAGSYYCGLCLAYVGVEPQAQLTPGEALLVRALAAMLSR